MNPSSVIARRYLFSKKKITLISVLTGISIAGVTVGTAMLIVVLSVFNGFFELVKNMMMAQDPDIRIESAEGRVLYLGDERVQELSDMPEIELISPYVTGKALVALNRGGYKVATVKGVEPETFSRMFELETNFRGRGFDLSVKDGRPGMLMSRPMMSRLGLDIDSEAVLLSAESIQRSLVQFSGPRMFRFDVRGSYRPAEKQDASIIYVDKQAAQRVFNIRNAISGIDVMLADHRQADIVKAKLETLLGDEVQVRTWYDLHKAQYDVMNLEKWGAYVVLMIIVLVAVLNIVGSLTMITIQKTRDIAMLRSIGFTPKDVRNVFLKQGLFIGIIGCGLGGGIGLLLTWLQHEFGLVRLFGAESFIIDAYPVAFVATDLILVLAGSLILCLLASVYPAARAASVDIADALRYE